MGTQTQYAVRTMSTDTTRSVLFPSALPHSYLQHSNKLCCTVLFTPVSYQQYSSTEAANWRGQGPVLPVPCRCNAAVLPACFYQVWGLRQAASQKNKKILIHRQKVSLK